MIINRLELLVADGRFDRALPLLDRAEASARDDGNPYAQQLVRRLRYCTLAGLGRKAEAAALLPAVLAHGKDARHATVDGLLCAGELDKAEAFVLQSLGDESFDERLSRALQPLPLTSSDPSVWIKGWDALRRRPAIAAAFARIARDMPAHLVAPAPSRAR